MTLLVTSFLAQAYLVIAPSAVVLIAWLALQDRLDCHPTSRDLMRLFVAAGVLGWLFAPGALGRRHTTADLIVGIVVQGVLLLSATPFLRRLTHRTQAPIPSRQPPAAPALARQAPTAPAQPRQLPATPIPESRPSTPSPGRAPGARPQGLPPAPHSDSEAYRGLLSMVLGDRRTADSLIRHERTRAPTATYEELIKAAIERLVRDRQ